MAHCSYVSAPSRQASTIGAVYAEGADGEDITALIVKLTNAIASRDGPWGSWALDLRRRQGLGLLPAGAKAPLLAVIGHWDCMRDACLP